MSTDTREITPEQAVRRAFWMIKAPCMTVLLAPLLAFIVLAKVKYIPSIGYPGMKWGLPTLLVSIVGGWLIWSVQVPRWRLWAYRRVKDISRLKELAMEKQLIWPEGSIFEKTEIMSKEARLELRRLEAESRSHGA